MSTEQDGEGRAVRVWTLAELKEVHPLPEPDGKRHAYAWAWRIDDGVPVAYEVGPAEPEEVWVCPRGRLMSGSGDAPDDVALPVILASKGLDSLAAMADKFADQSRDLMRLSAAEPEPVAAAELRGNAAWARIAASKVRRGTWAP